MYFAHDPKDLQPLCCLVWAACDRNLSLLFVHWYPFPIKIHCTDQDVLDQQPVSLDQEPFEYQACLSRGTILPTCRVLISSQIAEIKGFFFYPSHHRLRYNTLPQIELCQNITLISSLQFVLILAFEPSKSRISLPSLHLISIAGICPIFTIFDKLVSNNSKFHKLDSRSVSMNSSMTLFGKQSRDGFWYHNQSLFVAQEKVELGRLLHLHLYHLNILWHP